MTDNLLLCTDLDRTLIPNGPHPESPLAGRNFSDFVSRPEITLAYVSGRDCELIKDAIKTFSLPTPDFVIGDVGTTIYQIEKPNIWKKQKAWENYIAKDWDGKTNYDLQNLLEKIRGLNPQESYKQNLFKLSFYTEPDINRETLTTVIEEILLKAKIQARLIWSMDESSSRGLLDILPISASKLHSIQALINYYGYKPDYTVFCGDSGNDLEVMASPIRSVLVANSHPDIKALAKSQAQKNNTSNHLYIAKGNFLNMNGNYSAGILEGVIHFFPYTQKWISSLTGE